MVYGNGMNDQDEDEYAIMQQMRLWDKKLKHLDDEMLLYIQQRAYTILEVRAHVLDREQLLKEME